MKWINRLPAWVTWGLALPLVALNAWIALQIFAYFRSVLTIFITATLLAFLLNYPVALLQRFRVPRARAVLLVLLVAVAVLTILGVTLIPTLNDQLRDLVRGMPTWIKSGSQQLQALQGWAIAHGFTMDLTRFVEQLEERISTQLQIIGGDILVFLPDAIGKVFDLILTIVMTFYLLLYGERIWNGIFQWVSPKFRLYVRQSLRQNFRNYFVGQFMVAVLMGTAMTIAFLLIQIPFGLLFGLGVGIMALFPFGTPLGIALVSLLAALKSVWLGIKVVVVGTLIDQVIENGVAPQLVGGFTGLNPVWVLVSLLIGVKVGGFLGLIVAVPIASSVKSMVDYFVVEHPSPKEPGIRDA
jgi:predicted PurR-regulated permease PerM